MLYTIALHTNEEEHTVPLELLESTTGLPLKKEEAVIDQEVVWLHKGKTPYKATIVGSQSCNMGKGNFKNSRGAKSGSVRTKSVSPDSGHMICDDDDNMRSRSVSPSDLSDEEEEGDFSMCMDKNYAYYYKHCVLNNIDLGVSVQDSPPNKQSCNTGKGSFKKVQGAVRTAKRSSQDSDHKICDDCENIHRSVSPSRVLDEEQGDFSIHC